MTTTPPSGLDVGIDLDGCLYDFAADFAALVERRTGRPRHSLCAPTRWDFHRQWGLGDDEFRDLLRTGTRTGELFVHGAPDPAGLDALRRLAADGHRLHVVSARAIPGAEDHATMSTARWLAAHEVPHHSVQLTAGAKRDCAVRLGLDAAIDDAVHHYDELDAADVEVQLMDRPWNAGHRARRVHSWAQFVDRVQALAHRRAHLVDT